MSFKKLPFSILIKEKREMEYIKGVYQRRVQAEIESYKDFANEDKINTIQAQVILMLNGIAT